jgi:hypothetical protein
MLSCSPGPSERTLTPSTSIRTRTCLMRLLESTWVLPTLPVRVESRRAVEWRRSQPRSQRTMQSLAQARSERAR